ncbi:PhoH family protein [Nitriliruptor alkaliphilus]|uniref:PhoH family protein n=1 Tax=Nitriliruptor alkaliphilus TaxID=427918 RepID=UPI0006980D1C|nr:PhoH family protein [Nitriliruptor alkaliphilus]
MTTPSTPAADAATGIKVLVPGEHAMVSLLGTQDELLRLVEKAFPAASIHVRGNEIAVGGDPADTERISRLFEELVLLLDRGQLLDKGMVKQTIRMIRADEADRPSEVLSEALITHRGRTIRPKTLGQKRYLDALKANTVTFGIGPAGTGKTYLAMGAAVQALRAKQVNRLILTRPAVEAGERLGFLPGTLHEKIDPYLKPLWDALHDMMEAEELIAHVDRGTIEVAPLAYMRGRAQPVSANVLTPTGFRPIGDLAPGDEVIGSDGQPTEVLGTFPQGEKDIYRLTTQDGSSTRCTADHLWAVHTRDDRRRGRPARVLETSEMIGNLRAAHYHRYELPLLSAPVAFETREVPMDPYALGLLLGDGCLTGSTTPSFATDDTELAERLDAALPGVSVRHKSGPDYVLNREGGGRGGVIVANPVTAVLRDLELCGTRSATKFVPEVYLYNDADVRLGVLQGLLDSDGGPVTQRGRTCRIQYTTISPRLRDDVLFLVRSLGGVAYWRTRTAAGRRPGRANGRDVAYRHDAFVLDIRLPAGIEPFRLSRKFATYQQHGGGRPARFVTSIEPDGTEEAVCIRVAAADSLYVTEDLLVTHNTLNDAFIVLDEAQNTTAEQMKMFLTRIGFNSKAVVTGDISQVDLPSGKRSGLRVVRDILGDIEGVAFAELTSGDVVRHHIVQRIVEAYERHAVAEEAAEEERASGRRDDDRR